MAQTKDGSIKDTGCSNDSLLEGIDPKNFGLIIHVYNSQSKYGGRVEGPFRLIKSGNISMLKQLEGQVFNDAEEVLNLIDRKNILNRNSLKISNDIYEYLEDHSTVIDDIEKYKLSDEYLNANELVRESLIKSRIGQGQFRHNVIELWQTCSISGLENAKLLIASHIKPWKVSSPEEKLDCCNGLLLIPNYDSLFDKGFISFKSNGAIMLSNQLSNQDIEVFKLQSNISLRKKIKKIDMYMDYHRENVFRK